MELTADDPHIVGRYQVLAPLGTNGMARVLLGADDSGRRVALTVVHAAQAAAPGFRERFRHEVQLAATAPPSFVAPVLDADPDAERPWLANAFVEGPSLRAYVAEHGALDRQGTVALAVRMADVLVALHGAGLVHRDLNPSTVILAEDGPRLTSLGISWAGHSAEVPEFVSPEQAAGAPDIGPASDVFSFGSLIGFAATRRSPFASASASAVLHRVTSGEPDLGPIIGRLRDGVLGCLAKNPAARPTAVQVRDLLRSLDEPEPVAVAASPTRIGPPVPPPQQHGGAAPRRPPSGPRWGLIATVVGAAVLGAGLAIAAVLLLGGIGGGAEPGPAAAGPPATERAAPPATSATPTRPAGEPVIIDGETDDRFGTGSARFATPSGNIACLMSTGEARCDVVERTWQPPARPADCAQTYGTGAVLAGTGEGELSCGGDTVAGPSLPKLAYGQAVRFDGVVCESRESGLRCENEQTGHGFTVARASYDLF